MRLSVWLAFVVSASTVGCGLGQKPEYDPVKDTSTIWTEVRGNEGAEGEPGLPAITLLLTGKGKAPANWEATMSVVYRDPKVLPDFWKDKVELSVGNSASDTITGDHAVGEKHSGRVSFKPTLDQLATLVGQGGKYALNGKWFQLSPEELGRVRSSVIAARESTNDR